MLQQWHSVNTIETQNGKIAVTIAQCERDFIVCHVALAANSLH